jgi:hypothetical protein
MLTVHPGYLESDRVFKGPGLGPGVRSRVGVRHRTLTSLLSPLLDAGLRLATVEESGPDATPDLLTVVAVAQ